MHITLRDELPFVTVSIHYRGATIAIPNTLIDTGSASTLLSADIAAAVGIFPEPGDRLRRLRGVGGHEVVFARHIDRLELGSCSLAGFEVEIGGMDYGFDIGGILGMDALRAAGALLDLQSLTLKVS